MELSLDRINCLIFSRKLNFQDHDEDLVPFDDLGPLFVPCESICLEMFMSSVDLENCIEKFESSGIFFLLVL